MTRDEFISRTRQLVEEGARLHARARGEEHKAHRLFFAFDCFQNFADVGTAGENFGVPEIVGRMRVGIDLFRPPAVRAQAGDAPIAFVVVLVEMFDPFVRLDLSQILSEKRGVELEGKF